MPTDSVRDVVRFGPYEVNFVAGELRKHGARLRIQAKPLAILKILLDSSGQVVTREQLRQALWGDDVFVDFEKNVATAVNKLRAALNDSADAPRYIETIPRRGYRFIAPVETGIFPSSTTGDTFSQSDRSEEKTDTKLELAFPGAVVEQSARKSVDPAYKRRAWSFVAAGVALLLMALSGALSFSRSSHKLREKDTIVLADFANSTGDPVFDDSLRTALAISLRQSPFLNVVSDNQIASTMKLMTYPANTRLTPEIAQELCHRTGSKAYLSEAIARLGTEYVLQLKAVSCETGKTLAQERAIASSRDTVVDALGSTATKIRAELGETLSTVQSFDTPLEQATTSSIEALKAYTLAQKTAHENGAAQSLPYCQRAIELDPNFAMAYEAAGIHYFNLAEPARAAEYLRKAFELREHASQRERLKIMASYYSSVSGELEKAVESYRQMIASYPRDIAAYNNLGILLAEEGQYQNAVETTKLGISIAPEEVTLSENLTGYLLALQNFDEAHRVIRDGQPRKPDNYLFPAANYLLAFLSSDVGAMQEQQKWFASKPEYATFGLALASDTEAIGGRLSRANELTKRAVDSAIRADRKETGAIWEAIAAQREAAYGNAAKGRLMATAALKLAPNSDAVQIETALAFALARDSAHAEALSAMVRKSHPSDMQTEFLWLPAIQARLDLNRKDSIAAIKTLQSASSAVEFGTVAFSANASGSCLYPTYIRGQAYLAAGNGKAASAEFQKILDHSGLVWTCWTGGLARLGEARANVLQANAAQGANADAARARAISDYNEFFAHWQDADPGIPILKQAKSEYAKLM
jgi:DNA-binding winged helix-turn-helix (wHTH) protein/tetratricopeptide (TPR) repeat protein